MLHSLAVEGSLGKAGKVGVSRFQSSPFTPRPLRRMPGTLVSSNYFPIPFHPPFLSADSGPSPAPDIWTER